MTQDFIEITSNPIEYQRLLDYTQTDIGAVGAVSSFIGITRGTFNGRAVKTLFYESYVPLALKSLQSLAEKARSTYQDINRIAISHRIGEVPIGEMSVVICVSSAHRRDSLRAVESLIDWLKEETPIWKKEIYMDGNWNWKQNCECNRVKDIKADS